MRTKSFVILILLVSTALTTIIYAQDSKTFRVGAAVRNITPTKDMFPLTRKINVTMVGVLDSLHVRAIAFSSGGAKILMISSETGHPLPPQVADALSKHTGIPLDAIFFTSTHSHATPVQSDPIDLDFKQGAEVTNQQRWVKLAQEQILAAADEALANMRPASVGIGYSESYINVNRNVVYNQIDKDGKVTQTVNLGYNPTGVSDKTLAAIRFNDEMGKPIAFIINYAVHCVVMYANTCIDGKTGVSADIAGKVSGFLEEKYPGSVAVWLSGAAGNQNPIIMNQMSTRNPMTGVYEEIFSNSYDILTWISKIHFADIETALSKIKTYSSDITVNFDYRDMNIPSIAGGNYIVSLQLLRIGDIALASFPGEAFVQLGLDVKQNSLLKNTLFVNLAWQRTYQNNGYHADAAAVVFGGFGTKAKYISGTISPALVTMTNTMIRETNDWTFNADRSATNNKTGKRVSLGTDGIPGTADDNQIMSPAGSQIKKPY